MTADNRVAVMEILDKFVLNISLGTALELSNQIDNVYNPRPLVTLAEHAAAIVATEDNKIRAIKALRSATDCSLFDAKYAIEEAIGEENMRREKLYGPSYPDDSWQYDEPPF